VFPSRISVRNGSTYIYPFGYSITLRCRIFPTPPSDSKYSWSCSTGCLDDEEIEQSVNIKVTGGSEIYCKIVIDDVEYTSESIKLQTEGK